MALNTYADISASYVNDILEDAIFVTREQNLMANLVTLYTAPGYAPRVLPIYPQLVAQSVAENVDFSNGQTLNKTTQATFTPGEVMAQALLSRQRYLTDPDNAQRDIAIELGGAVATKVDTDLTGHFDEFASTKGTAGSALTINHVAAAVSVLINNTKLPMGISVVLHPYQWHDVWVELGQPVTNNAFLGDVANEALRAYAVGSFVGAGWFSTSNVSGGGGGTAYGAAFKREALALDVREDPYMGQEYDDSARSWELNMHMGYAHGVRRSTYGVGLVSDASEPG
jgi:hypothetical protein